MVRFRLSYKIFGALLLTSLAIVILTVVSLRFFMHRDFKDYINKVEMEKLSHISNMLGEIYQRDQGWERLKSDRHLWAEILSASGQVKGPGREVPSHVPDSAGGVNEEDPGAEKSHRPDRPEDFFVPPRVFLLDEQRRPVAGKTERQEEETLVEIKVGEEIVGWLGLRKRVETERPSETTFLKRQYQLFYMIGGGIFILTALVSFLLARHLLAPIKKLMDGSQALTDRQFAARIDVHTSDELGQLASSFNMMAQALEKYEEMRKQWISDISHELRTPISILRGEIEAIQDGVRGMNRETLDSLHSEVLHVARIVHDLHELSLADARALSFKMERIRVLQILENTIDSFRARFDQKQITIINEIRRDQDIETNGDKDRLTQLYSNLLENALRYADSPGTLKIWQEHSKNRLKLFFEDSGPGVPEDSVVYLFDRLYRVDKSRSRALGGSGLGLSICRSILEVMGGEIHASNASGGGLLIDIMIPLL